MTILNEKALEAARENASKLRKVAAVLASERVQGWANPLVSDLVEVADALDHPKRCAVEEVTLSDTPIAAATEGVEPVQDGENRMRKISAVIRELQEIHDRFGDTCVYIRRGGMAWGAVALNRRDDDEKHGVFDLQAQHDREMVRGLEQIERLIADRNEWRDKATSLSSQLETVTRERDEAQAALKAISDMFMSRPDMVTALHPLMGPAEIAAFEQARAALSPISGGR